MSNADSRRDSFGLGPWKVDPEEAVIRGPNGRTKVDYKAMDVLCLLADRVKTTVSREAIFEHVWPNTAVTDDVLNVAISTLRRALQDDARNPTYIKTLPKRGYSLLVAATPVAGAASQTVTPRRLGRTLSIGAIGAVTVALVLLVQFGEQPTVEASIDSIAVLPFKNLSGDDSQQYLADGITEALTTRLAKRGSLAVASSASVKRLQGADPSATVIGRALDVDMFLEGSVQVDQGQFRLHARLVDAKTERHVWANDYDRPLRDLLGLQSELVAAIATKIEQREVAPESTPPVDPEAYDLYLRARYLRHRESAEDLAAAVDSLERCISLSPEFAAAYTALAEVSFCQVEFGFLAPSEGFARGRDAADRAIAIDPDLPEAHAARGIAAFSLDWDFAAAGHAFRRALDGGDVSISTLKWYLRYLVVMNRPDDAVAIANRIREIDPLSYVNLSHAFALSYSGRHDAALERMRELESLLPPSARIHAAYAQIYLQAGLHDDAAEALLEFVNATPWPADLKTAVGEAFARDGAAGIYRYLASDRSPLPSTALRAKFMALVGQDDEALALLEESVAARDMNILWINADRSFDRMRSSVRFASIVRAIGLLPQS